MTGFLEQLRQSFRTVEEAVRSLSVSKSSRMRLVGRCQLHQRDINNGKIVGLKLLDKERRSTSNRGFKGLKKPSEGEISMKFHHPRVVETIEHGETISRQPLP